MSQWQPIETAPKGPVVPGASFGPVIALASRFGHRAFGYWSHGGKHPSGWVSVHDHLPLQYWSEFSHWMQVPDVPEQNGPGT